MRPKPAHARGEAPRGEINIAPLVDVCLVLLIISMVVVPMIVIRPPETPAPGVLPRREDLVTVSMKDDGSIWYESKPLRDTELTERLAELHLRNGRKQILLVADGALRFQDVRRVMGVARAAGFGGVNLAARKERH